MKTIHNKVAILFLSLFAISCSNDDGDKPSYAVENPLEAFHTAAGFTQTTNFINSGMYEFGLAFSPNVAGVMKEITVKLPDENPTLRVTIWDYDAQTVLRSEIINVATADVAVTKVISNLTLVKDKKYLITMNSDDWYKKHKTDNANATYPIMAGNIKFWEYRWMGGTAQVFPTNVSLNYDGGDLSFNFQQTE